MTYEPDMFAKPPAQIICEAVDAHRPSHIFAMFSGGHDSLCAVDIAFENCDVRAAVHVNTGIGIRQTREFVRDTAAARGWPLLEYHPTEKPYKQLVAEYGFPGPGFHGYPYSYLKERCFRRLIREHKQHARDRIVLITGVRKSESKRRAGHVAETIRQGAAVWTAPILYWDEDDKWNHIESRGLPRNEVVSLLHMSGECLCGAFGSPEELAEIRLWYPEAAAEIDECARIARANGKHDRWGERPPVTKITPDDDGTFFPLCVGCEARAALVQSGQED